MVRLGLMTTGVLFGSQFQTQLLVNISLSQASSKCHYHGKMFHIYYILNIWDDHTLEPPILVLFLLTIAEWLIADCHPSLRLDEPWTSYLKDFTLVPTVIGLSLLPPAKWLIADCHPSL